jgi:L-ribulokinase
MQQSSYVLGIDFGTDSVRALVVDTANGREIGTGVVEYPRWKKGKFCDPSRNQFRQHPLDYVESMTEVVQRTLRQAPAGTGARVRGIAVDTTGSTPVAVDRQGTPLALTRGFELNPNAMFVLWKDHTAVREAEEINRLARTWGGTDFTKFEGGIYSSEWFWAKILHVLRDDDGVRDAAFSWVEHCDWIPALLTGNTDPLTLKRSRCAAGHKAMWHSSFGGLPSGEFLTKLDPLLAGLRDRLYRETFTSDIAAGALTKEWAAKLGLSSDVKVGVGAFDAHMGAVGGEIEPYVLTKIMGTSTCDMIVAPAADVGENVVRGICGQVDGSIIPGLIGMEAGQSAFGDVYAWFRDLLLWPLETFGRNESSVDPGMRERFIREASERMIAALSEAAAKIPVQDSSLLALDWLNGRRSPDANQKLKGAIAGLTLGSDAPRIFRALVEATAFGARAIVDRFRSEGVRIDGVIALGGVAKKSPFIMQIVSDVLNMPIRVPRAEQTCALGAAMCAAAVIGAHPGIDAARKAMGQGFEAEYRPRPESVPVYQRLYERYLRLAQFTEREITASEKMA